MIRPNPMDKKKPTLDGLAGPVGCVTYGVIMQQKNGGAK